MGAVGFCDDVLLLAQNRCAKVQMLKVCETFAKKNNLKFSTDVNPEKSKTKCIFLCGKQKDSVKPAPLTLYGKELPWVSTATHLGHEFHEDGSMSYDVKCKKNSFISRSSEVRESFSFAHPTEIIRATGLYCCDFYGAMVMNLNSKEYPHLYA